MKPRQKYLLALLALVLIGGIIRAAPVFSTPLWFDEADTWRSGIIDPATSGWNAQTDLYEPVAMSYAKFFKWENHFETAPLTFLLSRISCDLFGTTAEWAMRLPSLIAGILCIPAAFWLGRVVRGDVLGLITAGIVAFDPSQVDQSQQCRMYTLMMLFMLLAIALSIKMLREPAREGEAPPGIAEPMPEGAARRTTHRALLWTLTGICYGLLLWCTQFNVAVWVGIAMGAAALLVMGFVTGRPHRNMKGVAIGLTYAYVVGLLVANVGIYVILKRATSGEVGDRPNLGYGEMAREIVVAAKDLINLRAPGLGIYVLAAIGLALLFKKCKTSTAILAGVALANVLILFRFLRIHHFMDGRYLTCIQPAVFIGLGMFAIGWANLRLRQVATAIIVLFIAVQAWQATHLGGSQVGPLKLQAYYQQPDRYEFPRVIQQVRDTMKPSETASIYPGVGCILGQYYKLPQDPALFTGLYKMEDHLVRDVQKIPADLKASAVHLILGMHNYDTAEGKQKKLREATIQLIAAHYGVKADQAELDKHIKQRRVVRAHISKDGVKLESVGVE